MSVRQYNDVRTPRVPRNKFNLSHSRLMSCDPFYLYPCLVEDAIPGDHWKVGAEVVVRNNPLAAPIMHEQNCYIHYYFVPYRLLWKDWEKFITGGVDGQFTANIPNIQNVLSTYSNSILGSRGIMDYLGFNPVPNINQYAQLPNAFPFQAYIMIWNEYYRDPNLMYDFSENDWSALSSLNMAVYSNESIPNMGFCNSAGLFKRCWHKDYFTSMLPWQQRGIVPSFDLHGLAPVLGPFTADPGSSSQSPINYVHRVINPNVSDPLGGSIAIYGNTPIEAGEVAASALRFFNGMQVDLSQGYLNADVHDMRFAFQVTKFLERNARTGHRYVEFLKAHYPAYPRDDRLQRPEYIGGMKVPIVVSEVLQTAESSSSTESGVGNMLGHGVTATRQKACNYRVQEHGVIMGLMSFMPNAMYMDGVERMWLKKSKYDFYFPEFMNLSEQAVSVNELYNYMPAPIDEIAGYQGRYDEYRFRRNSVHGMFRDSFSYWHMARKFSSHPTLNRALVMPSESEIHDPVNGIKRVLQVPLEPMYLVHVGNSLHVTRPLPYMAEPGYIDHN